jgi:hypothetical protein
MYHNPSKENPCGECGWFPRKRQDVDTICSKCIVRKVSGPPGDDAVEAMAVVLNQQRMAILHDQETIRVLRVCVEGHQRVLRNHEDTLKWQHKRIVRAGSWIAAFVIFFIASAILFILLVAGMQGVVRTQYHTLQFLDEQNGRVDLLEGRVIVLERDQTAIGQALQRYAYELGQKGKVVQEVPTAFCVVSDPQIGPGFVDLLCRNFLVDASVVGSDNYTGLQQYK